MGGRFLSVPLSFCLSLAPQSLKQTSRASVGGAGGGENAERQRGGRFPLAFVVLVFLKRPRLNWTYWPTNTGAVPTESRDPDNTDPRPRGGEEGERGTKEGRKDGSDGKDKGTGTEETGKETRRRLLFVSSSSLHLWPHRILAVPPSSCHFIRNSQTVEQM